MIIKNNKAIFSNFIDENALTFNYIDVGARGDISSPWDILQDKSLIVGFEPDPIEANRLNKKFKNRKYFNMALWSKCCNKNVYINKWESTSSMYKPNVSFISKFQQKHWEGRLPVKIVNVECDTLDNILSLNSISPDFIKIDTQGSELEILKGSKELLLKNSPIVTCETWCAEVYKDAPMMHEVISFMDSLGYQVFDMEIAAAWKNDCEQEISCKQKSIGYEVLFVKNINNINADNEKTFLKFILLLELYGYRDYAIYLLGNIADLNKKSYCQIKNIILKNSSNERNIFTRAVNRIRKKIFHQQIYPSIKY